MASLMIEGPNDGNLFSVIFSQSELSIQKSQRKLIESSKFIKIHIDRLETEQIHEFSNIAKSNSYSQIVKEKKLRLILPVLKSNFKSYS